jgi:quercetin 2,3-dioxygenase
MEKRIDRVIAARERAARSPTHANRMIVAPDDFAATSPFLVLVEDWFGRPSGFPTHPHRGIQTVTFVLDGALEHRDHTGGHGVLREGDVQWMTAGRGVLHSELPHEDERAHTLQLWLNLPAAQKMIPARYVNQLSGDVAATKVPGGEIRTYAGKAGDAIRPHGSDWPMTLRDIRAEAGARLAIDVPAADRGFLYAIEGHADIGTPATPVSPQTTAWFEPSPDGRAGLDRLVIAAREPFRGLLFSSPPIDEPVVAYGPFVMNSEQEIRQAYADYQSGRFVA